jgi:Beta-lactamase
LYSKVVGSINGGRESIMQELDQTSQLEQVAAALAQLRGIEIDEQAVLSHVIRPAHRITAISDQGAVEALAPHPPVPHPPVPPVAHTYALDMDGFISGIEQELFNAAGGGEPGDVGYVGYEIRLNEGGSLARSAVYGYAHWPADGAEDWAPDVRQHVASLSKNITAMAMTKALIAAGLPPDGSTPIIDYLPTYWAKGPNIDQITIAELLTHTSGITQDTNSTPADFQTMKEVIAAGVSASDIGNHAYRNVNFTLCRVLLATITGELPVDWSAHLGWPWTMDQAWDLVAILYYEGYVARSIFAPAGVNGPSLQHRPADALAYPFYLSEHGWNSLDLSTGAGADGWHMTANEVLAVMGTFRRTNAILTPVQAQNMLDAGFGIDFSNGAPSMKTQLGLVYVKSGFWSNPAGNTEQGVLFYLPQDMELVVLVNSAIGPNDGPYGYLASLVYNAYIRNIKAVPLLFP